MPLEKTVVGREGGGERGLAPGNLPLQASSFVGREEALAELGALLGAGRLLTLTGPGGCGKTRLALEVADGRSGRFRDGVFWVDLAAVSDATLVPESAARAVGAMRGAGTSPTEGLLGHLKPKETLLILDNCEHLVAACCELADTLLRACPNLRILATSREALGVPGERAWPVPSLSLPGLGSGHLPEEASRYEAVRLFVERAAAVAPGFALTGSNVAAVTRVCERLDGIPLAIELAAARARVLSPAQISARLDDRFLLLTGGGRVALPRQRTLRATMDWSHDLLSADERALFRRLSVFAGGFNLEAAEFVCSARGLERDEVLGLLSRLVDKSLVLVTRRGDEARYRMLETVLRYASEKLAESGEGDPVGGLHAGFFLGLAEEAEPGLVGGQQGAWVGRLDADHGNLTAALGWHNARGNPGSVLRMAGALWWFWFLRGRYAEARGWLEGALAASDGERDLHRAKALVAAGDFAFLQSEYAAAGERLEEGLALYRSLGDERGVAGAVQLLGSIAREQGRYERAESLYGESLALWRGLGDEWGEAQSLNYLGFVAWLRGDHDRATDLCTRTLGIFRRLGDGEGIAWSLMNLGAAALYRGDDGLAAGLLDESLGLSREAGYREGVAWALNGLGVLARREGRHRLAADLLRESLTLHRDLGDRWRTASVLEELAGVAGTLGGFERAAVLGGAADALREALGDPVPPCERAERERDASATRAALGEEARVRASAKGRAMTLEEAYEYALGPELDLAATSTGLSPGLTAREAEVLGLAAEGLTDAQVARKLYLSPRTVGQHLRSVYRKLGVGSRTAAARAAIERGII